MNLINTGALARCIPENENLKPFQRLLRLVQTVKTVWRIRCLFHRAKASVLMIEPARKSGKRVNLALAGARSGRALPVLVVLAALGLASCRPDMANQPRAKPLSESDFFSNGTSARQPPLHTVAHGDARENTALYTGLIKGIYVTQLPLTLTSERLTRGRDRFDAMCAECHDRTGSGNGMVVQRGFPQPPSFHVDRLRNAPIGHFFDVISNGYGVMSAYAARVEPEDRWAIAAYIRALQLNHNAKLSDIDPAERAKLEDAK